MKNAVAKEVLLSTLKEGLGALPFGGLLYEYCIEVRSKIKQDRINTFISEFAEYMNELQIIPLEIHQIKKEEFGDFFEEVIIKISKNHSEIKKEAFKKLLANQLLKPQNIDYASLICDIISSLQEKQIPILNGLLQVDPTYVQSKKIILEKLDDQRSYERQIADLTDGRVYEQGILDELKNKITILKVEVENITDQIKDYAGPYSAENYNIPQHEFHFLVQDLCNKGLLTDVGIQHGAYPYSLVDINQLGIDLLKSIE